nr:hypothetical protein 6 [bacterium]
MPGNIDITTNLGEVQQWLKVESKNAERSNWQLIAATALSIMNKAKTIAPVLTGRYRASIHIEAGGGFDQLDETGVNEPTSRDHKNEDAKFKTNARKGEILIGTNVVYSGQVERRHRVFARAWMHGKQYLNSKMRAS